MKKKQNLSFYNSQKMPSAEKMRIAIVVSEWNKEVTELLFKGAEETLLKHGCPKKNILRLNVPGSFELVSGAKQVADNSNVNAVICVGCVIQGETRHFEFICQAVANGIMQLNLTYDIPFVFGVLTTENMEQAKARAGGKHGNKGVEAAVTAIRMAALLSS